MLAEKKGKIIASDGTVSAYLDENTVVKLNGEVYNKTIRTPTCEILCKTVKCCTCKSYLEQI